MTSSISRFIIGSSATAVLAFTLALPGPALAQRGPMRLGSMQHNQQMAVRQGVKSGAINKQEANKLAKGEKTIRETEQRDKANGPTGAEAVQLKRDMQRENTAIKQDVGDHNAKPPSH